MRSSIAAAALAILPFVSPASDRTSLAANLHADGPYGPQAGAMGTFGRLIGEWDLVVEYRQADGSWLSALGEWQFGWILGGRAIQDVWTVYQPGADRGDASRFLGYGTTVRVYDSRTDSWHVNWMGVLNHNYTLFEARAMGTEIVMQATDDEGQPFQWVFHDITDQGFRWQARSTSDGGKTWEVEQRMVAGRTPSPAP